MSTELINYNKLMQNALRDVVRAALFQLSERAGASEHYFFITFATDAVGVQMSAGLRKQYPDKMTIVLQHQFWGLKVFDDAFEVFLSFNSVPEKFIIPFKALLSFVDPLVCFALDFTDSDNTPTSLEDDLIEESLATDQELEPPAFAPEESAVDPSSVSEDGASPKGEKSEKVVSLAAFRRKQGPGGTP